MLNSPCFSCDKNGEYRQPSPEFLKEVLDQLTPSYADRIGVNADKENQLPTQAEVQLFINDLIEVLLPGFYKPLYHGETSLEAAIHPILYRIDEQLYHMIFQCLKYICKYKGEQCITCEIQERATEIVRVFMRAFPKLRETLKQDIKAAYDGDPAAVTHDEVILSYPGLKALTIQRLAHILYHQKVPLVPRMMTEIMHSTTGIDIHPGAHIDDGVFIDHGTGVVVGETAVIGAGVKIYQGVTLGALSFPKDEGGALIRGSKRHPTIGKNVTIYAGATILGDITIGDDSVIGGNVWLTESQPPRTKIISAPPAHQISKVRSH